VKNKLRKVFDGNFKKTYIISEIGVNHNGSLDTALKLIYKSYDAGVDAVKFQKRNSKFQWMRFDIWCLKFGI